MATTRTLPRKRTSKNSHLIPMTFMVTPRMKANLEKRAKETGVSVSHLGSLLLDWEAMGKTVVHIVKKELKRTTEPLLYPLAKIASKTRQTNRILRRVLENPSEDIATILKQVEEEAIN